MNTLALWMLCAISFTASAQSVREKIRLDEGWTFAFGHAGDPAKDFGCGTEYFNYLTKANSIHNEGPYSVKFKESQPAGKATWQEVRLPHDWVTTLPYAPGASHSHGYKTVGYKYPETSVGWYRKWVNIPADDLGKHIALQFDGIFRNARVWFNGFYMGTEPSGYATQVYDVSEYVNYGGDNLICVRADASLEEGWFYEGAGIYRDAWLLKSAAVSVDPFGTFVYADMQKPFQQAIVHVETDVTNHSLDKHHYTVEQRLLDADGREVASCSSEQSQLQPKETRTTRQVMSVTAPHLWSTTDPYLYQVETTVKADGKVCDVYHTTTGLRTVDFDADSGFLLNGEQLKLKGVNMHQDHAGVGAAIPEALMAWRIKQLKAFGCNAYRASHNPMTPAQLDICDREGILVIDENRLAGINTEHLRLLQNISAGLRVNEKIIDREVREYLPFIATENLLMEAVKRGGNRQQLHEIIRRCSMEAAERMKEGENCDLLERLASCPEFGMTKQDLISALDPAAYIGRCPLQVDAFLKRIQPVLGAADSEKTDLEV